MSKLLLSGIINIIAQHDAIVESELKIKALEHENISNQARIEALENWVLKQDDQLHKVNDKLLSMDLNVVIVKKSKDIEAIKKKIISLEIDMNSAKKSQIFKLQGESSVSKVKKCTLCSDTFHRHYDRET